MPSPKPRTNSLKFVRIAGVSWRYSEFLGTCSWPCRLTNAKNPVFKAWHVPSRLHHSHPAHPNTSAYHPCSWVHSGPSSFWRFLKWNPQENPSPITSVLVRILLCTTIYLIHIYQCLNCTWKQINGSQGSFFIMLPSCWKWIYLHWRQHLVRRICRRKGCHTCNCRCLATLEVSLKTQKHPSIHVSCQAKVPQICERSSTCWVRSTYYSKEVFIHLHHNNSLPSPTTDPSGPTSCTQLTTEPNCIAMPFKEASSAKTWEPLARWFQHLSTPWKNVSRLDWSLPKRAGK